MACLFSIAFNVSVIERGKAEKIHAGQFQLMFRFSKHVGKDVLMLLDSTFAIACNMKNARAKASMCLTTLRLESRIVQN